MVGHRFCEKLVAYDLGKRYRIVTFCEEPRAAYDRVGLTSFFAHRDAEQLMLARMDWYREQGIELHVGDRATRIDRDAQVVHSEQGCAIPYDEIVLATGSYPFVPPMEGTGKLGVFVYRTIEDLERIIESSKQAKSAAVLGGGLLGLEAAKATYDLGMTTHVVEFAQRLMPRQVDDAGSRILVKQIESMGVEVHLNRQTQSILGNGRVTGLSFADGESLDVDMVVISAGIRPRDELARESGIAVGERGGIVVDDALQTSDPCIFAIGEVALHQSMIYGLVAPGYEMADILASNLCGKDLVFQGADLSAKLKLMGVDVASFGDNAAEGDDVQPLIFEDPFAGIYKKLLLSKDGKRLLGGVLVGDASEYSTLVSICKSGADLPVAPGALIAAGGGAALGADALSDDAQVCSCNAVTKGQICEAIQGDGLRSADDVKTCTQAGAGCGGCMPLVTDIFNAEMEKAGVTLVNHVCEHFSFSRQELFEIIKIKQYKSFPEVLRREGTGHGCELCKPTVASILASLWNDPIVEHDTIQDSNDRFLANIQRTGLYSVVPRVPGGEITPDKLIVLGEVAKKYDLYTKITGGQRVDLFGARVEQLPDIWEELISAGFESGHAYGKALRTVKSCVGTTWCRFGVQDAVGFAIRVEERYRGIRSPHKLKGGVSGCTRECAEAQSKDFGLIATEKGWNLFVCGNGGRKPRHADLFATDLDEETVIRYIDRFLMYYIHTADKLTRTSVWLEKMDGGIDYLREVIVDDKLGICDALESEMNTLVETYVCEWRDVVNNPVKRAKFTHFANSTKPDRSLRFIKQRDQRRPDDWDTPSVESRDVSAPGVDPETTRWMDMISVKDVPHDGGVAVSYGHHQIAIFNFAARDEWYASQNMCPHQRDMVLSRGIVGDASGTPKVACPMHKKTFALTTGEGLSDPRYAIQTFDVNVEDGRVFVKLPPVEVLDAMDINAEACSGAACGACA